MHIERPEVAVLGAAIARVGESPVWSARERWLAWTDIEGRRLHRVDADGGEHRWDMPEPVGCLGERTQGGLVLGMTRGWGLFDPATGALERIGTPLEAHPGTRFNDGACDPAGRFWAGTMVPGRYDPVGTLYRLDPDGSTTATLTGFRTVNGLAFCPLRRRMYVADTHRDVRAIWVCDFDLDRGLPANRRLFASTDGLPGRPDGAALDVDGCYWVAGVGGWQLLRYAPDGRLDRIVELPVERPSKIAFGGPGLRLAHVTTIADGLTPGTRQPLAGRTLTMDLGIAGMPVPTFAG